MHKVTKDALTLIVFSAVASVASYFYTFAMARMLSIGEYSLLYSLIALTYILSIPQETIRTVISVYVAKYRAKKENGKINWLVNSSLKKIFIASLISFIIFVALIPLLMGLFHTNFFILLVAGSAMLASFILPVFWGVYQGFGKFKALGINNSIEQLFKLGIAILLVLLIPVSFKIYGALIAVPLSLLAGFLIATFAFKYLKKEKEIRNKEKFAKYSLATLMIFGFITVMYSIDVIMARYFFNPKTSGIYAGISLLCKAFFFIATGTKRAMIPNLAGKEEKSQEKECRKILKRVSVIMGILFAVAFILFLFFPGQIISLVLGNKYIEAAPYLKYMLIAMALLSFTNLLVYYNLSINKGKKMTIRVLASGAFLEIVLLILFHKTITQFIIILLAVYALLFLAMLIVTIIQPKHNQKEAKEFEKLKKLFAKKPHKSIKR